MAKRGRKPKPAGLRIREGNREHKPIIPDPLEAEATGDLDPPIKLDGRKLEIWNQYVRRIPWLTFADAHTALAWVTLAHDLEQGKHSKTSLAQLKTYSNLLGLNPGARAERLGNSGSREKPKSRLAALIGKEAA